MKIFALPPQMVNALRSWFHPKDRHIYLKDSQWIISRRLAWETAISKLTGLPGTVACWSMSSVNRSTAVVFDMSGQNRFLTYNGTSQFNIHDNFVPFLRLSGAAGNYLTRLDEAGLDITASETHNQADVRGLSILGWARFNSNISIGTTENLLAKFGGAGARSYRLVRRDGLLQLLLSNDGTTVHTTMSDGALQRGGWFFVAGTLDPGVQTAVYIGSKDGLEQTINTASVPASVFAGAADLYLGADSLGGGLLTGDLSVFYLGANLLDEELVEAFFEQSRRAYGV